MELDPDLRLYMRLTLGRGWQLALTVALWTIAVAALALGIVSVPFATATSAGSTLPVALLTLLMAPTRAITRLFDLERDGQLDLTRLCGRPPLRTLAAFLLASAGPFVIVAAVLVANHWRLHPGTASIWLAVLAFAGALSAALVGYGTLPAATAPDSRFLKPLMIALAFLALVAFNYLGWFRSDALDPRERTAALLALAAVVPALWLARRRLERPLAETMGRGPDVTKFIRRVIPTAGPPEFMRQLRSTLLSGGTLATLVALPLAVFVVARFTRLADLGTESFWLNTIPYSALLIGSFAASMTIRREIEANTIDFVRLTPQAPELVAVSWYVAIVLPFWVAAGASTVALRVVAPDAYVSVRALAAAGLVLPALCLAEGFQRRRPGTYLFLPFVAIGAGTSYVFVQILQMQFWSVPAPLPWNIDLFVVLPAVVTAGALGASAGRIRRAAGPALVGIAAVAAATAIVFVLRFPRVPAYTFPRLVVCLVVLVASFAAEEQAMPSSPWRRLALLCGGVGAAVAALSAQAGFDAEASLMTAAAAALALAIGLMAHELLWRTPLLSLAARASVAFGLLRSPLLMYTASTVRGSDPPWIPPQLEILDLGGLTAAFAVLAVLHARRRLTA